MNIPAIEAYINKFYGYGRWDTEIWFVGMEEGGCGTLDEFQRRLEVWKARGCRELEDCPDYHRAIGIPEYFDQRARLQSTWEKLIRIFLSYQNLPHDTEAVRNFQRSHFGGLDCGFASLELFPLPSIDTDRWIYRSVKAIPFLINREVYKYYIYPRRAEELKRRIALHNPKFVVIYGLSYKHEWEGIIGHELILSDMPRILTAVLNRTRILVVPHPVSRNNPQGLWGEIGRKLREVNEKNEPNEALERSRLPVTISAISSLREGTDRARQPARSV